MKTKILKLFWHNKMQHINKDRIANSIRSMSWHTTSMDTSCRDIPLMTLAMVHSNTKVTPHCTHTTLQPYHTHTHHTAHYHTAHTPHSSTARNSAADGLKKIANTFEEKVNETMLLNYVGIYFHTQESVYFFTCVLPRCLQSLAKYVHTLYWAELLSETR